MKSNQAKKWWLFRRGKKLETRKSITYSRPTMRWQELNEAGGNGGRFNGITINTFLCLITFAQWNNSFRLFLVPETFIKEDFQNNQLQWWDMDSQRGRNAIHLMLFILPDREKGDAVGGNEKSDGGACFVEKGFQVLKCIVLL